MKTCIVLTKEEIDNFIYIPEYADEYDAPYTWNDLMKIAKGNKKVAYLLYEDCTCHDPWAHPETYLNDDLCYGEVIQDKHGYYYINPEYDFDLVLR